MASKRQITRQEKDAELREEAYEDVAHIPDRDQMFGSDHRAIPRDPEAMLDDAWTDELEDRIKEPRVPTRDTVDDFASLSGIGHVPEGGDEEGESASLADGTAPLAPRVVVSGRARSFDRAGLRGKLDASRADLVESIAINERAFHEMISADGDGEHVDFNHPADLVEGDRDHDKVLRLIERQRGELALVDSALHRLDGDDFGVCEVCGEDIPSARLEAMPYATRCVECQQRGETASRAVAISNGHPLARMGVSGTPAIDPLSLRRPVSAPPASRHSP